MCPMQRLPTIWIKTLPLFTSREYSPTFPWTLSSESSRNHSRTLVLIPPWTILLSSWLTLVKVSFHKNTSMHPRLTPQSHSDREHRRRRRMPAYTSASPRNYSRSSLVYSYWYMVCRMPRECYLCFFSIMICRWTSNFKVFENLTGSALFELYESPSVTLADSHLQRMIEHLGGFPLSFLADCSRRTKYFNEKGEHSKMISICYQLITSLFWIFSGELLRVKELFPRTIEECLAHYGRVGVKDLAPAAAFIRKCLAIDPSSRPSASELLQDEWFSDVF